ncbi:hypothetical protein J1C82_00305 [Streptococcus sanguinis]|uniref:CD-NTase-associated protein 16 NUDIX domain-containing protein n=1 Tax=Streptococcus sanguinis SK405 TaxID=888817 RepID=A0ABC9PDT0_STRSA|nr:hypothetical protein [Streptococcus sanguinis]EGC24626.1 hypothetical protein HMPREF9390_1691 [Streptococcus sanguinis SK405]MBF1701646.1 hypothetical protein [Streptococcus sanguinis]
MMWLIEKVISAVISFVVGGSLTFILTNRKYFRLWISTNIGKAREKQVRFSLAYLFRIKIDGKYLLVENSKIANQYQPIGGVYKKFASFDNIANELGVTYEKKTNFIVSDDLRVYVQSKNTIKFVKWFHTRKNREFNVIREFFEEIIDKNILEIQNLKDIEFEFIKTYDSGLHYTEQFGSYEILLHDIFEVRLKLNDVEEKLKQYIESSSDNYLILVGQDNILQKSVTIDGVDYKIGEQTKNIL